MTVQRVMAMVIAISWAASAMAGQKVDEGRPATPNGLVTIENIAGSIEVSGWDRAEVRVTGELGRNVQRVAIETGPERVGIQAAIVPAQECRAVRPAMIMAGQIPIFIKWRDRGCEARLRVVVPKGSRVEVRSQSADVHVADLTGAVQVETVTGDVGVGGSPQEISVKSISGAVSLMAATRHATASSVSGKVTATGGSGELIASSVSGPLDMAGGTFERVDLETVSASVRFAGALAPTASLQLRTVKGEVTLAFPPGMGANLSLSSFSGKIDVQGSEETLTKLPGRRAEITVGGGGGRVAVETFSGDVTIRRE